MDTFWGKPRFFWMFCTVGFPSEHPRPRIALFIFNCFDSKPVIPKCFSTGPMFENGSVLDPTKFMRVKRRFTKAL